MKDLPLQNFDEVNLFVVWNQRTAPTGGLQNSMRIQHIRVHKYTHKRRNDHKNSELRCINEKNNNNKKNREDIQVQNRTTSLE
jgi:hypothetical protein